MWTVIVGSVISKRIKLWKNYIKNVMVNTYVRQKLKIRYNQEYPASQINVTMKLIFICKHLVFSRNRICLTARCWASSFRRQQFLQPCLAFISSTISRPSRVSNTSSGISTQSQLPIIQFSLGSALKCGRHSSISFILKTRQFQK